MIFDLNDEVTNVFFSTCKSFSRKSIEEVVGI